MDRRTFLKRTRATSGGVVLWSAWARGATAEEAGLSAQASESGQAFDELLETLGELERSFRDPADQLEGSADLAEARRHLAHVLQHALETQLEVDAAYPVFVRFVTPEKKLLGDNPDAIYYTTPVSAEHRYRIRGNLAGATYTSFTVERRNPAGGGAGGLAATLNDTQFAANADGSYEIAVSAQQQPGNWLRIDPGAMSITTRHYYEREVSIARDRLHHVPLVIEHTGRVMPRPAPDEASVAAGLRRAERTCREVGEVRHGASRTNFRRRIRASASRASPRGITSTSARASSCARNRPWWSAAATRAVASPTWCCGTASSRASTTRRAKSHSIAPRRHSSRTAASRS